MKKLLLILLCLPMIGFGQDDCGEKPEKPFNKSSKEFQEGASLGGEIMCIGNDSNGNIYSIQMGGGNRRYEIHTETPTLPSQIKVTPANERFNFAGTPIASTVDIEAFNYDYEEKK